MDSCRHAGTLLCRQRLSDRRRRRRRLRRKREEARLALNIEWISRPASNSPKASQPLGVDSHPLPTAAIGDQRNSSSSSCEWLFLLDRDTSSVSRCPLVVVVSSSVLSMTVEGDMQQLQPSGTLLLLRLSRLLLLLLISAAGGRELLPIARQENKGESICLW